jgi:hypothetical protein
MFLMGFEHRTSCFRHPNFARQSGCGARTTVGPLFNELNIIHIKLMLLKK